MKNKLEVGMYVRYKRGSMGFIDPADKIGKIINQINNSDIYELDNNNNIFENDVVKASYNLIDILKVGDVIIDKEGHKYPINYEFETDYNGEYKSYEITIDDHITLFLKDGLSIVTHEQMEQMSYRIGDEE